VFVCVLVLVLVFVSLVFVLIFVCVRTVLIFLSWRVVRLKSHTHCSALQHTATHHNTLQHTVTHCKSLQHTATPCFVVEGHVIKVFSNLSRVRTHRRAQETSPIYECTYIQALYVYMYIHIYLGKKRALQLHMITP